MTLELIIAGGLVLIFGISTIVYVIGFYGERGDHQVTRTALETCRDSHRRARSEADKLQREVWDHPGEVRRAEREGRRKLAEEIRDAEIETAETAIKGLNDRLTALDELREAGAITQKVFEKRDKKLREGIDDLVVRIAAARQEAQARTGVESPFFPGGTYWP